MIKLELNPSDVNTILRVLGKHPFDEVVALILKIKQQGDAQIDQLRAEQAAAAQTE
jgi:hypothetical protein